MLLVHPVQETQVSPNPQQSSGSVETPHFPLLPQPSAILAAMDAAHLRIWLVMLQISCLGNPSVAL
jgi:hypothetical protein